MSEGFITTKMVKAAPDQDQARDMEDRRSSLPTAAHDEIQQSQVERGAETPTAKPAKGDADPEKPVPTQPEIQEKTLECIISGTPPALPETNAATISSAEFGAEDEEHITGFRLLAALFGIISVFFIVLLDFSIISTVSGNKQAWSKTLYLDDGEK